MNILPIRNQLRWCSSAADKEATASSIAEHVVLDECIGCCEALADLMVESETQHPLFAQLSECISACHAYLASLARESIYQYRFAALCRDILITTARGCRELQCDTSDRCAATCQRAASFLAKTNPPPVASLN